jgi:acylpyruvate hydrolase
VRLINFEFEGRARLGVRVGERVVDLSVAAPALPSDLNAFLALGSAAMDAAASAAESMKENALRGLAEIRYLPPNSAPSKILCLGVNFPGHASEAGLETPAAPEVFMRGSSSLIAHEQALIRPTASEQLDYEAELAVIIGQEARHVSKADALSFVGGYAVFNDASVRDYQLRASQWTLGKNFDGTGSFGPELVTPDELPKGAAGLRLQSRLNGKQMQDANLSDMIFGVEDTIALLTECMTLHSGDVIIMGTCDGVGLMRDPPVFMKQGDVCEVEIEGIGVLRNPIVDEQPTQH